ncbi:DUF3108 domain-containing protein [Alteromonas aestuariivivens]|uniref:DUF3108 domain-containing protein n=2 Tax=Alteromonas aestuariivivens TaxID=1938339 RepID=A0A3D8MB30_9ALTE|nr:DUF3108 domain-containing protein [Alteromonas aestuariivivens]
MQATKLHFFPKFIVTVMLMIFGFTAHADDVPESLVQFHAKYTAYKWGDDVGTAEIKLQELAPQQYALTYSSEVSKFFLSDERFEYSVFHLRGGKLVPAEYRYKRKGTGRDSSLTVQFSQQPEPTITISDQASLPWNNETDNQLYRIDVPLQLAAGKRSMAYHFINYRGEPKTYQIDVVGEENIEVPFGRLDTIKVKIVRQASSRETFAWFAPTLDYNLVRLQQFKDGQEQGDLKLSSYIPVN